MRKLLVTLLFGVILSKKKIKIEILSRKDAFRTQIVYTSVVLNDQSLNDFTNENNSNE